MAVTTCSLVHRHTCNSMWTAGPYPEPDKFSPHPTICTSVIQMVSFLQVFLMERITHFSALTHLLLVLPILSSLIQYPYNIWQGVHMMKLFIMQHSPDSCHFLPHRSKHFAQHHVPKHPQPVFFS